ncbi:MAG: class I SAM-dependent methyltransferase [Candidatus Methanoperedens sp.]|nr:class I SAM-dependent methyltransferase [Candidatus Methanoperedens sp.]
MDNMVENRFEIEKFYDNLSESWDKTRPEYTQEIFRKITFRLDKNSSYSIFDFGCGTGLLCEFISDNFSNVKIEGIDISGQMIEKAKTNCLNCNFYVGDVFSINLPNYDVIISKDVFNHIKNIPLTISRLNDLLNSKGNLIIANREREQNTKDEIVKTLETLNYEISTEYHSFKPTKQEIDSFIEILPNFKEDHKNIIKRKLENSDKYYIIFADKKRHASANFSDRFNSIDERKLNKDFYGSLYLIQTSKQIGLLLLLLF